MFRSGKLQILQNMFFHLFPVFSVLDVVLNKVTHDGKWVYVTTSGSENDPGGVYVIDTATRMVMP
jgi:hypothetical protein